MVLLISLPFGKAFHDSKVCSAVGKAQRCYQKRRVFNEACWIQTD